MVGPSLGSDWRRKGMEASGLESVAKGLADGSVSRRKALKIGGGGILGGIAATLGWGEGRARAASCNKPKCSGPCAGSTTSCSPPGLVQCGTPPGGFSYCTCVKSTEKCKKSAKRRCKAKKICVAGPVSCGDLTRCSGSSECPSGQLCSQEFKNFCCKLEGSKGVCLTPCSSDS
jgi:hypothetical protein